MNLSSLPLVHHFRSPPKKPLEVAKTKEPAEREYDFIMRRLSILRGEHDIALFAEAEARRMQRQLEETIHALELAAGIIKHVLPANRS